MLGAADLCDDGNKMTAHKFGIKRLLVKKSEFVAAAYLKKIGHRK
jgi:hypothetical protein